MNPEQFDSELKTYYTKIKNEIKEQHQEYLKDHPELREILNDFLSQTLLEKPQNVYDYSREYFSYFNIEEDLVKYQPLVITGPYGSGKSTISKRLIENYPKLFQRSISYTTRAALPNETHGVEYYFVSKNEFQKEIQKKQFLQFDERADGNYFGTHFGKLNAIINNGKIPILELSCESAQKIQEEHPDYKFLNITAPLNVCKQRIETRTDLDQEQIKQKIELSQKEMEDLQKCNFKEVQNATDLETAYKQVLDSLKKSYKELQL